MSVLIKMEMPTSCYKCPLKLREGMTMVCPITHETFSVADTNFLDYRLDSCPLVPVSVEEPFWIPVTERLPDEEVEVLISDNSFFGGPIVAVAYWVRGECEWRDDMSTASPPHPTHWMPLPELPKEEH